MRKRLVLLGFSGVVLIAAGCQKHGPGPLTGDVINASSPAPLTATVGETIYFENSSLTPVQVSSASPSICKEFPNGFNFPVNPGAKVPCTITTTQPLPYVFTYGTNFQPKGCPNCQVIVKP